MIIATQIVSDKATIEDLKEILDKSMKELLDEINESVKDNSVCYDSAVQAKIDCLNTLNRNILIINSKYK